MSAKMVRLSLSFQASTQLIKVLCKCCVCGYCSLIHINVSDLKAALFVCMTGDPKVSLHPLCSFSDNGHTYSIVKDPFQIRLLHDNYISKINNSGKFRPWFYVAKTSRPRPCRQRKRGRKENKY